MDAERRLLRPLAQRVIILTLVCVLAFLLCGSYLARQGVGFLADRLRARSNRVAASRWPQYADFLAETEAIRTFGVVELGLKNTKSYTTFINTPSKHVVHVVSAARPLAFERKTWRYPVVGTVPYKGFYGERAAIREAARLELEGWEVLVRKVGAFSSLGYTADPLYSYMSTYDPERIASILLHEMTHSTIWVRDDVALNEAIATYVGDRGALEYLEQRHGLASEAVAQARRRQAERARFTSFVRALAFRLEGIYQRPWSDEWKRAQREAIVSEEKLRFEHEYSQWFADDSYRGFLERPITNAYLDVYRTYNDDVDLIAAFHRSLKGSLADLVAAIKELHDTAGLRTALESFTGAPSSASPDTREGPRASGPT
ncbi:MAG: aminopeptidase [Spirochaetota bacterium]